jgi:hypothetical protein
MSGKGASVTQGASGSGSDALPNTYRHPAGVRT